MHNIVSTNTQSFYTADPAKPRLYAVGDIHGRLDCLQALHERIANVERHCSDISQGKIIYLGDYIDRGPQVAEVIDFLISQAIYGLKPVYLMGNHEYALLLFMQGKMPYANWLQWGADTTLRSYGVEPLAPNASESEITHLREDLIASIPSRHHHFYRNLLPSYETEDYFFVHAGIRPGVAFDDQSLTDLLMIREDFLDQEMVSHKTIIHGHTVFAAPHVRHSSIGIDTGAIHTGILTAIKLENKSYEFITSH